MKKLLQKMLSMAMVFAVLCPSIGNAYEPTTADYWKVYGGVTALVGAGFWYKDKDEVDKCRDADAQPNVTCANLSELEDDQNISKAVAALGLAAVGVGFFIGDDSAFQVRPILNGVALERDGFSFSAVANGRVRLEKRWEF